MDALMATQIFKKILQCPNYGIQRPPLPAPGEFAEDEETKQMMKAVGMRVIENSGNVPSLPVAVPVCTDIAYMHRHRRNTRSS